MSLSAVPTPHRTGGLPPSAADVLATADWRRRTHELYADVRRICMADPAAAHAVWIDRRNELFADHPASPLLPAARGWFRGLTVAPYDPAYRFEIRVRAASTQRLEVVTGTDGVVPFERIGRVVLGELGQLSVWALRGYAGGVFLPVKDALAGLPDGTYGGGRYVLDTIKGADLGTRDVSGGPLVVDLNFAYNPSCAYDPAWACPLATRGNVLTTAVPVGELVPEPMLVADSCPSAHDPPAAPPHAPPTCRRATLSSRACAHASRRSSSTAPNRPCSPGSGVTCSKPGGPRATHPGRWSTPTRCSSRSNASKSSPKIRLHLDVQVTDATGAVAHAI